MFHDFLDRPCRVASGRRCLPLLIWILLLAYGCGKKGDPQPRIRYIPATTTDLSIRQQGSVLNFTLTYPQTTVSGTVLPGLEGLEIWELVLPLESADQVPRIDAPTFDQQAKRLLTLEGPELLSAITGDRITARIPLATPLPTEPELHVFAVRTVGPGGQVSERSNRVQLVLREPVPPPQDLTVRTRARGVEIAWESDADGVVGFSVYRRDARERGYGEPLEILEADARRYLDESARYGNRYIYTVRSVSSVDPLVESDPAGEQEVDYEDRFAPSPPRNLLALPEEGQVRLAWEPSPEADTAGYLVYRRDPQGTFRQVTPQPVESPEYLDRGLARGLTFTYRVSAVDRLGNEGEPSDEVEATVR